MLLPAAAFAALALLPTMIARRRMRRLLLSGDVERVILSWQGSLGGVPHRETLAPLLRATAYAAYGCADAARRALARAPRGAAWDASMEQRLVVEIFLDVFDGERDAALRKATALSAVPKPRVGPFARRRISLFRAGVAAFARAFAHASHPGDGRLLVRAAGSSPLVHWAMRYAAAVVAVDEGRPREVTTLLAGAPAWPEESAFGLFHSELVARAAQSPS
jgi:hypothetical protein